MSVPQTFQTIDEMLTFFSECYNNNFKKIKNHTIFECCFLNGSVDVMLRMMQHLDVYMYRKQRHGQKSSEHL